MCDFVISIILVHALRRRLNNTQNSLHTLPRNFPVDGEAANLLWTCYRLVVHVADLWTCYGEAGVMDFGLWWTDNITDWTDLTL